MHFMQGAEELHDLTFAAKCQKVEHDVPIL